MFKNRFLPAGIIFAAFCFSPASVSAQTDFDAFWTKFKAAVINNNKAAVANLTQFPLEMPYGVKDVRTRAAFLKDYASILNKEADARRCFQATKPVRHEKAYAVWCTFKDEPESSENRPIGYYFAKTRTGWKFVGIDNINE